VHQTGGTRRVFRQFAWLKAGSVKVALSRHAHQRVTQAVGPLQDTLSVRSCMPQKLGLKPQDYYDMTPTIENNPGDIWSDLPTFGILGDTPLTGIVITPACDLSNRKVETIAYLPVIPVRAYFSTPAFMPDIFRAIEGQLQEAKLAGHISLLEQPERFIPPSPSAIQGLDQILVEANVSRLGEKEKIAIQRVKAGLRLLSHASSCKIAEVSSQDMKLLFGEKKYKSILKSIICNSYSLDIHFLPSDKQDPTWSGVPQHSVALFRYVLSAPVEIFDCAQDISLTDWPSVTQNLLRFMPGANAFSLKPMKRVSLRHHFLADLITRYVAMYVRLGSPDFTYQSVNQFVEQIGDC